MPNAASTAAGSRLFTTNRQRLSQLLQPRSLAVLNANDVQPTNADGTRPHVQNADLYYLTGIRQEETLLVLAPDAFEPGHREILFLREPNEHLTTWEGHKLSQAEATRISGIRNVRWLSQFPTVFRQLMCEMDRVYLNSNEHPRATVQVESRDLRFIRQVQAEYPLHQYHRLAQLMHQLRVEKAPAEIELIRAASDLTGRGLRRVLKFVRPAVTEAEVQAEFAHEFTRHGGDFAYPPIIAAGANNCILHYIVNDRICRSGQLLLLDVAAAKDGYMSDLTRTIPVNGRFTRRQRQVYDAVLRVFREMVKRMIPGKTTRDLRRECEALITEECLELGLLTRAQVRRQDPDHPAVGAHFMHGVSHPIGLDVHDVTYNHYVIQPGWVLTCEPAIYIPKEGFGVRLENTVAITGNGPVDLMADLPLEADEIEEFMSRGRAGRRRRGAGK
ncbi:MAG: aminopeptidase P N-terminal domain-containing protein [Verrucomicrobia bacterium]|nr:aminopeptidase P N-terminal domain-containing protein [Verrucomicrobiota bacterium]